MYYEYYYTMFLFGWHIASTGNCLHPHLTTLGKSLINESSGIGGIIVTCVENTSDECFQTENRR